jgi:hypothetical protein
MTVYDLGILIKKITVGIIIYLIPVFLLIGGLLLTKAVLKKDNTAAETSQIIQP